MWMNIAIGLTVGTPKDLVIRKETGSIHEVYNKYNMF